MSDIVKRLREDEEMLRDGLQQNLNDAWHNHTMKYAAKDCAEAADYIEALEAECRGSMKVIAEERSRADAAEARASSLEQRLREAAVETENFREPGEFGDGATMRRERE